MSKIDTIKANAKEAALATYSSERTASLIKNEIPFILDRLESLEAIADELAVGLTSWVESVMVAPVTVAYVRLKP